MPALGMAQETGRLVRWLKHEGEPVAKGEPLMEVETDKATVEVESPASGTLTSVTASEGDDVAVGRPIALILAAGETVRERAPAAPRLAASPRARRLAAESGVDLGAVAGTGPSGAVVETDLLRAGPAEAGIWRAMAENVSRSWREAPHFFVIRELDASGLVQRKAEDVTYTDLLVKAVADALVEHPRMNGSREEVNIGLAVAMPDGLLVPVIHNADRLEVSAIAARRRELLESVKHGKLRSSDLGGGTFTL